MLMSDLLSEPEFMTARQKTAKLNSGNQQFGLNLSNHWHKSNPNLTQTAELESLRKLSANIQSPQIIGKM